MMTRFLLATAAALWLSGCSGTGISSGSGGAGAAGGAGGAGGQTAAGGAGQGGAGGGTSSSSTMHAGSGGGPMSCGDLTCGNMNEGCIGCAFAGPCANQSEACYHDQDCSDYQSCVLDCTKADPACLDACKQQHPTGAEEFEKLYLCAVCGHCANTCPDTSMTCPAP
jgi:hypothetical protein